MAMPTDNHSLLSLPAELREKIYIYLFANIFAKSRKNYGRGRQPLAILQTCQQIHEEASSVLFQRTPLRFMIGHLQSVSSTLPPQETVDRFQHVFFKMVHMNTSYSGADFSPPFQSLTEPFIHHDFPLLRRRPKTCYIQAELHDHATDGMCGKEFQARVKHFMGFETLTIDFVGEVSRAEFPQEEIADDDPKKQDKLYRQRFRRKFRKRDEASLIDVERIFRGLQGYLGKGEILDVPAEATQALYAKRLVFHPWKHHVTTTTPR